MARRRARSAPDPRRPARAGAAERRASPRVLIAVAVAAAALVAVGVVLGVVLSGGSDSGSGGATTTARVAEAGSVDTLFGGIDQDENVLGRSNAPVTLVEYVDLQCPFCQQFETQVMPTIVERYVRTGKLRLEMRPLATLGADSQRGQLALVAAGKQGKLFQLAQLLYLKQRTENSGWLTDALIESAAASIDGLDVDEFHKDLGSTLVANQASNFLSLAQADRVQETPTVLVGKTGATLEPVTLAASDPAPTVSAIDAALG
jgi:protein-disulfide isomerase